jgi:hypothetical protein
MDRVLLVACRTAAGPPLLEAVRRRAALSPCQFALLVPRPCHGLHRVVDPEDHGWREAKDVIETACPVLGRAAGSEVAGMIGSHDPVAAVEDALNMHGFDEVIVSTLPARASRWLHLDLPSKVEGLGVRVTRGSAGATSPPRRAAAPACSCSTRERQGDLMTPGTITAYDAHGTVLAERPVAAVAYWHSRR